MAAESAVAASADGTSVQPTVEALAQGAGAGSAAEAAGYLQGISAGPTTSAAQPSVEREGEALTAANAVYDTELFGRSPLKFSPPTISHMKRGNVVWPRG